MKTIIVLVILANVVIGEEPQKEEFNLGEEKKEQQIELGTVIGIDLGTTYSW